jgi:hypothetical protein
VTAAELWPEADQLFRTDDQWVGGDGAYSVPCGADRAVWVFMDSLVCGEAGAPRTAATFINNTVGVQEGLDPTSARMRFFWGDGVDGRPASFFPPMGEDYLWPGNLVMVGDALFVSLMRVRHREWEPSDSGDPHDIGPLNMFDVHNWIGAVIANPQDDPPDWDVSYAAPSPSPHGQIFGTGGLQVDGDYLWTFAGGGPARTALCRWSIEDVLAGDLDRREWWCETRWRPEAAASCQPTSYGIVPTEYSVHRDGASGRWVWAQVDGLFGGVLSVAFAERPQGPWSERTTVLRPPEADRTDAFVYGGKAHVEQQAPNGELVLTYNNNGAIGIEQVMADPSIYYPTFVKLAWS